MVVGCVLHYPSLKDFWDEILFKEENVTPHKINKKIN